MSALLVKDQLRFPSLSIPGGEGSQASGTTQGKVFILLSDLMSPSLSPQWYWLHPQLHLIVNDLIVNDSNNSVGKSNSDFCLHLGFIAVKSPHDHGNSYKGKHFIGADLQVQRFSPLSSWWETRQHPGRHGAGGAESSTS